MFIILLIFFSTHSICQSVICQLTSKVFTACEVDFLVFSGIALSISRFISSSVTKANHPPILTLKAHCYPECIARISRS